MEFKIVQNSEILSVNDVCDILTIGVFEGEKTGIEKIDNLVFNEDKFEGKFNKTYLLPCCCDILPAKKVLVVGLGKKEDLDGQKIREAVVKAIKKAIQIKSEYVAFKFPDGYEDVIAESCYIGDYSFDKYKSEKSHHIKKVCLQGDEAKVKKGQIFGEAMQLTRDLANEPSEYATPSKLAEVADGLGLDVKIYDRAECEKMGMGAFLAVARGSLQEPKFIHLTYSCPNPKKKVAIIGKGLCFDSGGMNLKPAASMMTMRDDMSGAACVLGVMSKIKEFHPNVEVHGIIATCENMIGPKAYRQGDILTAKNGKTIEIDNTDAEGRVTMADALCYACELGVDEVIDIATLTGACMVALGTCASGIMGNDKELISNIIKTGNNSGERYWEMPMFEDYFTSLKSEIADMKNSGARWGGASAAGLFLKNFVTDNVKWAHLDIAGTAFLEKPQKEFIKGATGVGVRTLLNYIIN